MFIYLLFCAGAGFERRLFDIVSGNAKNSTIFAAVDEDDS